MAVGDDAKAADYPLVPTTGEAGKIKYGPQEINRTRDFVAQVKALVLAVWPISAGGTGSTTAAGARTNLELLGKMTYGTASPSGGSNGDIYFKYVP